MPSLPKLLKIFGEDPTFRDEKNPRRRTCFELGTSNVHHYENKVLNFMIFLYVQFVLLKEDEKEILGVQSQNKMG